MKANLLTLGLVTLLLQVPIFAQDRTTVNATNNEISDNLDLRAVASIFGDSKDLQDFEQRLNDPENQISNLDLNFDRQVDYLRVIEAVEKNTHLIILQAVLEKDVFQDVATIEVERDRNNKVQVQVVGDIYMYGQNYIYEPVYVHTPLIYNVFWVNNYNPYYSPYYFNYYPTYYYAWTPYPVYRYRRNVHVHINQYNYYNYSENRRSTRAVAMHTTRRNNGYERKYPSQSFSTRNKVTNRHALENTRNSSVRVATNTTRNASSTRGNVQSNNSMNSVKTNASTPVVRFNNGNNSVRNTTPTPVVRNAASNNSVRNTANTTVRNITPTVRNTTSQNTTRNYSQAQPSRSGQQSSTVKQSNTTRNTGTGNRS